MGEVAPTWKLIEPPSFDVFKVLDCDCVTSPPMGASVRGEQRATKQHNLGNQPDSPSDSTACPSDAAEDEQEIG